MSRALLTFAILVALAGCSRPPSTGRTEVAVPATPNPEISDTEGAAATPIADLEFGPMPHEVLRRTPDESLAAGLAFLLDQQLPDGSWRSDVYATFRDGMALTPLVVSALQEAARAGIDPPASAARRRGLEFLAKLVGADGKISPGPDGIDYPIYTAALTLQALCHPDGKDFPTAPAAWVKYLKDRQLTAKLGWKEDEKQYGGWGYCREIPQKPKPNELAPNLIESNLSATVFALEALKSAGELDAETAKAAAVFVRSCQNWRQLPKGFVDIDYDGGFHFIYDDPVRNKAGVTTKGILGSDRTPQFNSYGSATADGLRALDLCGSREDEPRRTAARSWIQNAFRPDTHPGDYVKPYEPNREAVYYYYADSVSRVMRSHNIKPAGGADWSAALAAELASRQKRNGSWINPVELVRENDPLVATSNAISALARCRKN